jgi:hypothetical protein
LIYIKNGPSHPQAGHSFALDHALSLPPHVFGMARRSGLSLAAGNGTLPNSTDISSGGPWANADLFFLKDALARGMSFFQVAGFLCRSVDEVREKAKALHACIPADVHALNSKEQPGSAIREAKSRAKGNGTLSRGLLHRYKLS